MYDIIYKDKATNKYLVVEYTKYDMPRCCGAIILGDVNIKEASTLYGNRKPLTKETWKAIDQEAFYKKVNQQLSQSRKRKFVTCVVPTKLNDSTQAYYHSMRTYKPVLSPYKLFKAMKWTKQKPWLNPESNNTLVSFYKDS